jgi:hypothetical protein
MIIVRTNEGLMSNTEIHNPDNRMLDFAGQTSAKQQISGGLSILVWAFPLVSQDQTRHENAKSMNCAMLGIRLLMQSFKYNSNIDIG